MFIKIREIICRKSGIIDRLLRAGEKQALSSLEKKLLEERKQRSDFQLKLETERKNKKVRKILVTLFDAVSPNLNKPWGPVHH